MLLEKFSDLAQHGRWEMALMDGCERTGIGYRRVGQSLPADVWSGDQRAGIMHNAPAGWDTLDSSRQAWEAYWDFLSV